VQFHAPVSGQVVKVNVSLSEDCEALDLTPYQKNWVCVIDGENLDVEVPTLKIGKSAVALFQDDIDQFRTFMKGIVKSDTPDVQLDEALYLGELEQLDDVQWEKITKEFFRR
jgi:hypothetical protein